MKNVHTICCMSRQLAKICEQIEELTRAVEESEQMGTDVIGVYEGLLMDEIEHVQVLTLEMTKMLLIGDEETNADGDGSVFAAGDLTDEKAVEADSECEESK